MGQVRVALVATLAVCFAAVAFVATADIEDVVEKVLREERERAELRDKEAATTARTKTPVYNCLEWSFCRKTGWSQPVKPGESSPPKTLEDLLTDEGFDVDNPIDCAAGGDHVIMLIWNVPDSELPLPPGEFPSDDHWTHALKRKSGKWSSKNGKAGHFDDIQNNDDFLDRHYRVPPRHTRIVRCFEA